MNLVTRQEIYLVIHELLKAIADLEPTDITLTRPDRTVTYPERIKGIALPLLRLCELDSP